MFLSIDAGNSNIVFGFYQQADDSWEEELRIPTKKGMKVYDLEKKLALFFLEKNWTADKIDQIGLSTVVPDLLPVLTRLCLGFFRKTPYIINEDSYGLLPVKAMNPTEIGTDLMANITAAYLRYNSACIIGVNIFPGIKTAINSLFTNTAKLPKVELKMPESALGKDTVHAIQAGIFYGYSGLVRGMIEAIEQETNCNYQVILTGGMSSLMNNLGERFKTVDGNLTLKGIYQITSFNLDK